MYEKVKEITFDGTEYYYNTGKYIFVFDPAEGGRIWNYKIIKDDIENCSGLRFELFDEFIKFAIYIKNLKRGEKK